MKELSGSFLTKFQNICWYPSAGSDFRGLMYLSKPYAKMCDWDEKIFPECFIFTDICGFRYSKMMNALLKGGVIFDDNRGTLIEAFGGKELQRLDIPFEPRIVSSCDENYGRVICSKIHIHSSILGELDTTLIYVIMENTSFAIDYLLKNSIHIDYYLQVRYGMGISSGMYVKCLLKDLKTRYFISDWNFPAAEDYAYEQYKDVLKSKNEIILQRTDIVISSYRWSDSGDVQVYNVEHD